MRVGILDFNPEQLELARKSRNWTSAQLAEHSGVSATTLSNWENGSQKPSHQNLERVANALQFPLAWFSKRRKNNIDSCNSVYLYRNVKKNPNIFREAVAAKLEIAAYIVEDLEEWLEFAPLDLPNLDIPSDFHQLGFDDIERIAEQCREYWQLGFAPIPNMVELLEYIGIVVIKDKLGTTLLDGVTHWDNGRPFVFLSTDKENAPRSRFDAAHELGHIILHRNLSSKDYDIHEKGIDKKEKDRRDENYQIIEKQAHYFAGCFLLPQRMAYQLSYATLDKLLTVKKQWGVSIGALIMRGKHLELIDDAQSERLFKNYSARGWRKGEPLDDLIQSERPTMLYNAFDVLIHESNYPKNGLVELFSLNESELISYGSLPNYFFNEESKVIRFKPRNR